MFSTNRVHSKSKIRTSDRTISVISAILLIASPFPCDAKRQLSKWIKGTATYYGDDNAGGTDSGTCGYGNRYQYGYGVMTAAASPALWFNAAICGACFEVKCANTIGCKPGSVILTVTNLCPGGYWCDRPNKHLDLSIPVFVTIAEKVIGHMPIRMRRVPCVKTGNARVTVSGNPWFLMFLFTNLAGSGDVKTVDIRPAGTSTWQPVRRNYGAVWSLDSSNPTAYLGRVVDFRLRAAYTGEMLFLKKAFPQNWAFGATYETSSNFGMNWSG